MPRKQCPGAKNRNVHVNNVRRVIRGKEDTWHESKHRTKVPKPELIPKCCEVASMAIEYIMLYDVSMLLHALSHHGQ
jgi:hypothetical protein